MTDQNPQYPAANSAPETADDGGAVVKQPAVRALEGAASLLAGPKGGVYVTPRLPTPGPDEIKIRLLRRPEGLMVHVTAPNPEMADRIVKQMFGENQPYMIELCG